MNDDLGRRVVLFLGGNGHARARLAAARRALERCRGPQLLEIPYPGFENRPAAATRDEFLDAVSSFCRERGEGAAAAYATGIGALIALALRARGELCLPLIFQGPVLWGIQHRRFPRIMRSRLARELLTWIMSRPWFQARLSQRLLVRPLDSSTREDFFDGYARCRSFGDLFAWFTPEWLEKLKAELSARPGALEGIKVWVGGLDCVVGLGETLATERALGVRWPLAEFAGWGHYPMIDEPEEWANALRNDVEAA